MRMHDKYRHPDDWATLLPYDFITLLAFLSSSSDRNLVKEEIYESLSKKGDLASLVQEDFKRFIFLFRNQHDEDAVLNDTSAGRRIETKLIISKLIKENEDKENQESSSS